MPVAAPDDPAAYRGVTFRTLNDESARWWAESDGQEVPWLTMPPYRSWENAGARGAPFFGYQYVLDGRRPMVWFYRLLEPPPVIASPHAMTPTPPQLPVPGPGESERAAALKASPTPAPPERRLSVPGSPPPTRSKRPRCLTCRARRNPRICRGDRGCKWNDGAPVPTGAGATTDEPTKTSTGGRMLAGLGAAAAATALAIAFATRRRRSR